MKKAFEKIRIKKNMENGNIEVWSETKGKILIVFTQEFLIDAKKILNKGEDLLMSWDGVKNLKTIKEE